MPRDPDPKPTDSKPLDHKDFDEQSDPAEGTPAETPSGPFAPPPMPDVLRRASPQEPSRPIGPLPKTSAIQSGRVFAIGMDFVYGVVGCAALGWGLDWWFKTGPRWLLIGAGIGIVVAMYRFIREGLRISRGGGNPRP